jgi:hypothetical protein
MRAYPPKQSLRAERKRQRSILLYEARAKVRKSQRVINHLVSVDEYHSAQAMRKHLDRINLVQWKYQEGRAVHSEDLKTLSHHGSFEHWRKNLIFSAKVQLKWARHFREAGSKVLP